MTKLETMVKQTASRVLKVLFASALLFTLIAIVSGSTNAGIFAGSIWIVWALIYFPIVLSITDMLLSANTKSGIGEAAMFGYLMLNVLAIAGVITGGIMLLSLSATYTPDGNVSALTEIQTTALVMLILPFVPIFLRSMTTRYVDWVVAYDQS